jgi:hypothetical protein
MSKYSNNTLLPLFRGPFMIVNASDLIFSGSNRGISIEFAEWGTTTPAYDAVDVRDLRVSSIVS